MKEHSHRTERVGDLIHEELARLITRELKDPRIGFVTITRVYVSRDMRTARVAVTILGDEAKRKESLKGLAAAQGFLRRELAQRLELRYTPALAFEVDERLESEQRIDELLRQMRINR